MASCGVTSSGMRRMRIGASTGAEGILRGSLWLRTAHRIPDTKRYHGTLMKMILDLSWLRCYAYDL